jgi:hypothetical protein
VQRAAVGELRDQRVGARGIRRRHRPRAHGRASRRAARARRR